MVKKEKINLKPIFVVGIILVALTLLLILLRAPEDYWMMDEKGIWIMHGNASVTPDYVINQQTTLNCVNDLYIIQKIRGVGFNYECFGSCGSYAVDMVHVPRIAEDNLEINQCRSYLNGTLTHFIEIDKEGAIVRVV